MPSPTFCPPPRLSGTTPLRRPRQPPLHSSHCCLPTCPLHRPRIPSMTHAPQPPELPEPTTTSRLSSPENVVLRTPHHDRQVLAASRTVRTVAEMSSHINDLRRQRLSLLLADLVARVRCEKPESAAMPPLAALLRSVDSLSAALLSAAPAEDAARRADMRRFLWDLRLALDPLQPSEALRTSLEVARSSFLDIPGRVAHGKGEARDEAIVRSEMYALMVENILLEELRSLRVLERQMNAVVTRTYPGVAEAALTVASDASALLGIDDYRVRGKMRLADAVAAVREELVAVGKGGILLPEVDAAIGILHNALIKSLQTDLSVRRPAGQAMLLRPRMDDIPNFSVVSHNILRGGQPSSRGLEWLSNYGVELVVDLRGSDRENQWEMPKCRFLPVDTDGNAGGDGNEPVMRFCNIPIEDFCTPSVEQVYEFIELVDAISAREGVVFVHCKAGIGRTGTMVACWRIFHGEPADEALGKERLYSEGGGGLRQEEFVRNFAVLQANKD